MSTLLYSGQRVIVVGYGLTGKSVAEFLRKNGADISVYDDRAREIERSEEVGLLEIDASFEAAVRDADLVVVSPGVPRSHPVYRYAKSPISELELAFRHTTTPIIAVTGTNGKTTVTTLVTEMLARAGMKVRAVGNIGTSMVSLVDEVLDFFVVEASSFQLATISSFRPKVAVWTNFSQDHLDWHLSPEHYLASKRRIFENQLPGDVAVVNGSDAAAMSSRIQSGVNRVTFGLGAFDFGLSGDGVLTERGRELLRVSDLPRSLPHDIENALASAAVAFSVGVQQELIALTLRQFKGLPHRVEFVRTVDKVKYYDDSKATTPASVTAAVSGFDSVVLIAGGKNKGLDLSPLATVAAKLRAIVAIGDSADEVTKAFSGSGRPMLKASSMTEAVEASRSLALPGDVVLLSPGCTSFDWYSSYAQRGEDFRRIVEGIMSSGAEA